MIETIESINWALSFMGITCALFVIFLIYDMSHAQRLKSLIARFGMRLAFISIIASSAMTLIYSEIFGIIPCGLCWFERVALYPQALLFGMAMYYKDTRMPRYGIGLSIGGLIVSLYHHYIQMGGSEFIKCPAAGADCAKRFLFEFGFMTFPLLSAILFSFLIVLYVYLLKTDRN